MWSSVFCVFDSQEHSSNHKLHLLEKNAVNLESWFGEKPQTDRQILTSFHWWNEMEIHLTAVFDNL